MIYDLTPPPDFKCPEIGLLAAALVDGTREVRQELGEVTPEELAFTPMPRRYNAAAVLLHHAAVEEGWIRFDLCGEPDDSEATFPHFTDEIWTKGEWPDLGGITLEEIYRRSDEIRQQTLARLATIEDARQMTVGATESAGDTARWVVNHLIGHESYHFGQAVLLVEMARARSQS